MLMPALSLSLSLSLFSHTLSFPHRFPPPIFKNDFFGPVSLSFYFSQQIKESGKMESSLVMELLLSNERCFFWVGYHGYLKAVWIGVIQRSHSLPTSLSPPLSPLLNEFS